uniref:Uncharacterized protein n=2 Tax=Arion vulgaris TaxID=1028688 RepID=A0A0B7ARC6_9EUPU
MNVYRDQVAFTRSIAATLASLFHLDLDEHFSNFVTKPELSADIVTAVTQTESEMNMVKCGTDITFSLLLLQVVSSLTSDLELLCSTCNLTDVYMNSARYTCLCQIVYTAKMLLILFDREEIWQCRNTFRENFSQLGSVVLRVCTELQLGNSLTC